MKYFEVSLKVTRCGECPHQSVGGACKEPSVSVITYTESINLCIDNNFQLTPSCPLWNKVKEQ